MNILRHLGKREKKMNLRTIFEEFYNRIPSIHLLGDNRGISENPFSCNRL